MADSSVVKFINEDLRPLAEMMRAVKARAQSSIVRWDNVLKEKIPDENDKTVIDDGRESEGVTQVKVDEVHLLLKLLVSATDQIDDPLIERFCVRALQVN